MATTQYHLYQHPKHCGDISDTNSGSGSSGSTSGSEWEVVEQDLESMVYSIKRDTLYRFAYANIIAIASFESDIDNDLNTDITYQFAITEDYNVANHYYPCLTHDDDAGIVYILGGSVNGLSTNIISNQFFLHTFNMSDNKTLLADVQPSDFGIESRIYGACEYSSITNSLYYFGGATSVRLENGFLLMNSTDTILKYDLTKQIWTEFGSLFYRYNKLTPLAWIRSVTLTNQYQDSDSSAVSEIWLFGVNTESLGLAGIVVFDVYYETTHMATSYSNTSQQLSIGTLTTLTGVTLFHNIGDNSTRVIIAGGVTESTDENDDAVSELSSTMRISYLYDEIYPTPSPTGVGNDILTLAKQNNVENDGTLIECQDLKFNGEISYHTMIYFDLTQYNNTRYFCSFGGYYDRDFTSNAYCYQITNQTCDASSTTNDNNQNGGWETLSLFSADLYFQFGDQNVVQITPGNESQPLEEFILPPITDFRHVHVTTKIVIRIQNTYLYYHI